MKLSVAPVLVGLLLSGCASPNQAPAQSPSVPPPATATPAGVPQGESSFYSAQSAPTAPATPAPTAPPSSPDAPTRAGAQSVVRPAPAAPGELDREEQLIASGDCPTACRALGSMERSVTFLCARTDGNGEAPSCADARTRLRASRRRVRASCGECAEGPSVDPNAPIPSR